MKSTITTVVCFLAFGVNAAAQSSSPRTPGASRPPTEDVKTPAVDDAVQSPVTDSARPEFSASRTPRVRTGMEPRQPPITHSAHHERLYSNTDGDGALWVRARAYKAKFAADGTTYIPYLGPRAPRNFPVTFKLASATCATGELDVACTGAIVREGDRVSIPRGSLVETYELSLDSIEQTFVLAARPAGDLRVVVDVESELQAAETEHGLELAGAHGSVRYGRASGKDANGALVPLSTRFETGKVVIDVPESVLASARFPFTIDPIVSTFVIDDTPLDDMAPDVAYDFGTNRWAAVYHEVFSATDGDCYIQLLNASGVGISADYIDFTTEDWRAPKIANLRGAGQFLVVSSVGGVTGAFTRVIRGRTCNASTNALGTLFNISGTESGDKLNPDVGGDAFQFGQSFYCVVWERFFSAIDRDICYQLVNADGTREFPLTAFIDNSTSTLDTRPSISKSNGNPFTGVQRWGVAWQREITPTNHDIRGAQIHWDGALDVLSFPMVTSSSDDTNPSAASPLDAVGGSRLWMVAFQRKFSTDSDIEGVLLNGGTVLTTVNLSTLDQDNFLEDQILPCADSDGNEFAVSWSESFNNDAIDYDPYIQSYYGSGSQLGASDARTALEFTGKPETRTQIASAYGSGGARRRYLAAWDDQPFAGAHHDIRGALFDGAVGGPKTPYCFGDGTATVPCPCGTGGVGRGCPSSVNAAGALLLVTGDADVSADTLSLNAIAMPAATTCLFFQGTTNNGGGAVFGDGLRCAGGTIVRLGTKATVGGSATYPTGTDADISVRGLVPTSTLSTRYYQTWYRNAAVFCTSATFNLTNGIRVVWLP